MRWVGVSCVLGAGRGRDCPANVVPPMQKDARQSLMFPIVSCHLLMCHLIALIPTDRQSNGFFWFNLPSLSGSG